jgi:hypothetical protein
MIHLFNFTINHPSMAQFEFTSTIQRSIFYHPAGTKIFVYSSVGSDLHKLIGRDTVLAEIKEPMFIEGQCFICGSKEYDVQYNIQVIDAKDPSYIGIITTITPKNAAASKHQSKANYFGGWFLNRDEKDASEPVLIKKVSEPTEYFMEETNDLIHIGFPGAYESEIIVKEQIGEEAVQKLREHYSQLNYAGYETIDITDYGAKIKGYRFGFIDKDLNFTVDC